MPSIPPTMAKGKWEGNITRTSTNANINWNAEVRSMENEPIIEVRETPTLAIPIM